MVMKMVKEWEQNDFTYMQNGIETSTKTYTATSWPLITCFKVCVPLWHLLELICLNVFVCVHYVVGVSVCDSILRLYIQHVHRLGRTSNTTAPPKGQGYFMSQHWQREPMETQCSINIFKPVHVYRYTVHKLAQVRTNSTAKWNLHSFVS